MKRREYIVNIVIENIPLKLIFFDKILKIIKEKKITFGKKVDKKENVF